jgi:hypothetical protein
MKLSVTIVLLAVAALSTADPGDTCKSQWPDVYNSISGYCGPTVDIEVSAVDTTASYILQVAQNSAHPLLSIGVSKS